MIREKKIIFFREVVLIHEKSDVVKRYVKDCSHSRIVIYSYESEKLPKRFECHKRPTPVVNLTGNTKEDILSNFNDTARNETKRTFSNSELVFSHKNVSNDEPFKLYQGFEMDQGRKPYPVSYFKDMLLFSATLKGVPISGIVCYPSWPVLRVFSIFSARTSTEDKELYKIIGYAGKRLIYELCCYGLDNKYEKVDLAYINDTDPTKAGISRYKMQFGSSIAEEHRYVYESAMYKLLKPLAGIKLGLTR